MTNNKVRKQTNEIDFVNNSSFKKQIRKTKWKQVGLYICISIITLIVTIFLIHSGSQYLIYKKIETEDQQNESLLTGEPMQGAGITDTYTSFQYNIFSAEGKTTYFKRIGNKKVVWDTETKKYPAIGRVKVIDRGSGMIETKQMDLDLKRPVFYNQLNNQRVVDFYYPQVDYDFLPQELDIATGLEKNKLIEIALSFKEPMLVSELGKQLGNENVDWLWLPVKAKKQEESQEINNIINGNAAYGIEVHPNYPYWENIDRNKSVSGAIISGTPQELKRFLNMEFIRTSTIGATIDKY